MWRLGKYLSSLTKPELEELKDQLNLTEEEITIFDMLAKRKSIFEISDKTILSERTVKRRIKSFCEKIERSKYFCKK